MNTRLRSIGFLSALLLPLLAALGPIQATRAAGQPSDLKAADAFVDCMNQKKKGAVLILLDQSASLGAGSEYPSDPENIRAVAASLLAQSMADFAKENQVDLWLGAAGFADDYRDFSGWRSIGDGKANEIVADLSKVGSVSTGWETDYWNALEGARKALRDKAREDPDTCRGIVWFSDGNYELDVRSNAALVKQYGREKPYAPGLAITSEDARDEALKAGRTSLCRRGGVADQLREAGVTLLAVGLQGEVKQDFSAMQSIATGAASGTECGGIAASRLGGFLLAANVDDLVATFDSFGGAPVVADSIAVDSSIRRIRVMAFPGNARTKIALEAPNGQTISLVPGEDGSQTVENVAISWTWVQGTSVATVILKPESPQTPGWQGAWGISFPDKLGRAHWHPEVDLQPAAADNGQDQWRMDSESATLSLSLDRVSTGRPANLSTIPSQVFVDATLVFNDGSEQQLLVNAGPAELERSLSVDLTQAPVGRAELRMVLRVTTADAVLGQKSISGTILRPVTVVQPLKVGPPAKMPIVIGEVDFGTTEGKGPLSASAEVGGEGCVWLSGKDVVTSPDTTGEITVGSPNSTADGCLIVEEGIPAALPLTLSTENKGNGAVSGELVFQLAPAGQPEKAVPQRIAFIADMRKPAWMPRESAALLLAVIGTLVPILILWAVAWWQARIIAPTGLRIARLPVIVADGHVVGEDGKPIEVRVPSLPFTPVEPKGQRSLDLDGAVGLRATARNPLNPHVRVIARNQRVWTSGRQGRLPLAVPGTWILISTDSSICVYLLISAQASPAAVTEMLFRMSRDLDELVPLLPTTGPDDSPYGSVVQSGGYSPGDVYD